MTADVSFISLRLVLPPVLACADRPWRALVLVKPQFEAGRGDVRRGVVRDPEVRRRVLQDFCAFVTRSAAAVLGVCDSCVPGPAGNREYVVYLAAAGHPGRQDRERRCRTSRSRAVAASDGVAVARVAVMTHGKPEVDRRRAGAAAARGRRAAASRSSTRATDPDLAVVLGGDGTMLRALQR